MFGIYNCESNLRFELKKSYNIFEDWYKKFPDIKSLFIDWIPKSNNKTYHLQATIVDKYVKRKIPIVIFDRYLSMTKKEYEWLRKFNNVFLFEPALHNRFGFRYLPQWTKILKYEDLGKNKKYEWDLGYIGDLTDKYVSFKKYYKEIAEFQSTLNVCYSSDISSSKSKELRYAKLKKIENANWYNIRCAVAIDTNKHYAIGYLDEWVFKAMEKGCFVMMPYEHKYFGNMFNRLVVKDMDDIGALCIQGLSGNLNQVIIEEIYNNIERLYPEFTINYTLEIIKECIK